MSDMSAYRYRLFGLTLSSEIELPELRDAEGGETDVEIRLSDGIEDGPGSFVVKGVAAYAVPDDKTILVRADADCPPEQIRLFLLGSAMGMLLYRRGEFPLHANASVFEGTAWAFFGASGAGKSTLAAWMARNGFPMMSDDVCVVRMVEGQPRLFGGVPRLRLWEDAAIREGMDPSRLSRSAPLDPDYRKFDVSVLSLPDPEHAPLGMLCLLDEGTAPLIEPLQGLAAVEALYAHSYRGGQVGTLGDPERHWRMCTELAQRVPMFRYRRSMNIDRINGENRAAINTIKRLVQARSG